MNYKKPHFQWEKSEIKDNGLRILRGFTLVELLVVIAIIAILFAVILVAINPAQRFKDSRNARRLSDVQSIAGAATTYTADKRGTPPADIPDGQCIGTKVADDFSTQGPQGVSWWELNDSVNPLSDSLIGGNPATASNIAYSAPGRFGSAITLNGINSSVVVDDNANIRPIVMSLELWMKLTNDFSQKNSSSMGLIDKGNYRLGLDGATGSLFFELDEFTDPPYSSILSFPSGAVRGLYALTSYNGELYAGYGGDIAAGKISSGTSDESSWSEVTSYPAITDNIYALTVYNGKLYVGQGNLSSNNGKIYSFDGSNWKMEYDAGRWGVGALMAYNGKLYAGAGGNSNTAEVFEYDGISWRALGFPGGNDRVYALKNYQGSLYIGTGGSANAQLWKRDNSSAWSQIAIPSASSFAGVYALEVYDDKLYIGLGFVGPMNDRGQVDVYDGSSVAVSDPGATTSSDRVYALKVYRGELYAAYGGDAISDRKVRVFKRVGGVYGWSAYANIPANNNEAILSFGEYEGKLYMGQYDDSMIGTYEIIRVGNGRILYSKKQKWNANQWYHVVVASGNGGYIYSVYINGALDNASAQSFGAPIEGTENNLYLGGDHSSGVFSGALDNVIFYNIWLSADTIASHAGCYNLGQYLVPEYMGSLPIDPSSAVTDGTDTGYFISKDTGGVITITAPLTETTSSIPEIIKASR